MYQNIRIGYEFEFCATFNSLQLPHRLNQHYVAKFLGSNDKKWRVLWDSSIKAPIRGYYQPHELVTPPLTYRKSIHCIESIFNWMDYEACKTNSTTGLHVNISFIKRERNLKIDPVKLIMFTPCNEILSQYKRQRNEYCRSYDQDFKKWARFLKTENAKDSSDVARIFADRLKRSCNSKHRAVSYRLDASNPYVEFRMIGNKDYHKRLSEVKLNIEQMIQAMYISVDDKACQVEYQEALSKYLIV